MMRITAANLANTINQLPKGRMYNYVNPTTKTIVEVVRVDLPEGPISIKRWNPTKGGSSATAKVESISSEMLWRVANALTPGYPINFDRILGASYNTRSALEALLAHTPEFYGTKLQRLELINQVTKVRKGHKHLVWLPNEPHENGVLGTRDLDMVISEVPGTEVVYDALSLPYIEADMDIEVQRRHAQIQIALVEIGRHLGYRTYVAQNDQGIVYKERRLVEHEGVIAKLDENTIISPWNDAVREARLIDVVWFQNSKLMPAVMEIEHTTGVTSGLTRMMKLCDLIPGIKTRFVIVADDEDRRKVISEISRPQFHKLSARYFPYSAVEELYALCQRRNISGVGERFLDSYMESVLQQAVMN
jgi:hypothetical protein